MTRAIARGRAKFAQFGVIGMPEITILVMVAFWGAVIWAVIHRRRSSSGGLRLSDSRGESATEVLDRRYAAGEITKEQLDQMRRDLQH